MTNYRLIMKLLLQGRSYRQIQNLSGAASATISKARKAMDSHGITSVEDLAKVSDATIGELIGDGRLVVSEDFADIDFEAVIEEGVRWFVCGMSPHAKEIGHYDYYGA